MRDIVSKNQEREHESSSKEILRVLKTNVPCKKSLEFYWKSPPPLKNLEPQNEYIVPELVKRIIYAEKLSHDQTYLQRNKNNVVTLVEQNITALRWADLKQLSLFNYSLLVIMIANSCARLGDYTLAKFFCEEALVGELHSWPALIKKINNLRHIVANNKKNEVLSSVITPKVKKVAKFRQEYLKQIKQLLSLLFDGAIPSGMMTNLKNINLKYTTYLVKKCLLDLNISNRELLFPHSTF